jgi:hypothetical protein
VAITQSHPAHDSGADGGSHSVPTMRMKPLLCQTEQETPLPWQLTPLITLHHLLTSPLLYALFSSLPFHLSEAASSMSSDSSKQCLQPHGPLPSLSITLDHHLSTPLSSPQTSFSLPPPTGLLLLLSPFPHSLHASPRPFLLKPVFPLSLI